MKERKIYNPDLKFSEKWKSKISLITEKRIQREKEQEKELTICIELIKEYTEETGVRKTARQLTEAGRKISHTALSQIRNGIVTDYSYKHIAEIAEILIDISEKNSKE